MQRHIAHTYLPQWRCSCMRSQVAAHVHRCTTACSGCCTSHGCCSALLLTPSAAEKYFFFSEYLPKNMFQLSQLYEAADPDTFMPVTTLIQAQQHTMQALNACSAWTSLVCVGIC
jgi:hypothetical protein